MLADPELRRPYARHFGGVNIGFLDGHARWVYSEEVIELSPSHGNRSRGRLRGYGPWGPTSDAPWYDPASGVPTLY
jgi:prepilin-type processing-associated H-X9-DG protein